MTGLRTVDDGIFSEDSVTKLPQVGPNKLTILSTLGLDIVGDIASLSLARVRTLGDTTKGLSEDGMIKLHEAASAALPGACVGEVVNHKLAENPYLSLYGEEFWEAEINKSAYMRQYLDSS